MFAFTRESARLKPIAQHVSRILFTMKNSLNRISAAAAAIVLLTASFLSGCSSSERTISERRKAAIPTIQVNRKDCTTEAGKKSFGCGARMLPEKVGNYTVGYGPGSYEAPWWWMLTGNNGTEDRDAMMQYIDKNGIRTDEKGFARWNDYYIGAIGPAGWGPDEHTAAQVGDLISIAFEDGDCIQYLVVDTKGSSEGTDITGSHYNYLDGTTPMDQPVSLADPQGWGRDNTICAYGHVGGDNVNCLEFVVGVDNTNQMPAGTPYEVLGKGPNRIVSFTNHGLAEELTAISGWENIFATKPLGTAGSTGSSKSSAKAESSGELVGDGNEAKVWNFFKSKEFSDEATAAIMGNIQVESGFDPSALQNGSGPAAGLFQWETYNDSGSRWGDMAAYAKDKGKDWTDLTCQLEFAYSELGAELETYSPGNVGEKITLEDFKKMTDIDKATEVFDKCYERSDGSALEQRKGAAKEWFAKFKGQSETVTESNECEKEKDETFGEAGIENGAEYHQVQGNDSNCGQTALMVAVNMLLGEKKYTDNVAEWEAMGSDSTRLDEAYITKWLKSKNLTDTIGIVSIGQIHSVEDLSNALSSGTNVVILSASGSVFKINDGTYLTLNHFNMCYKTKDGKFYFNDSSRNAELGAGVEYTKKDVENYLANGVQSIVLTRKK